MNPKQKHWYDYLWMTSIVYFALGLFNILFAWLGLICFIAPLLIAIVKADKSYCNKYCGRGQLFELLGDGFRISRRKTLPTFLRSKGFRYGFLSFFMIMFGVMLYSTYQVFMGATLKEAVTLLWIFKLPWNWVNTSFVSPGIAQFAFGFYGVMLTSAILGLINMIYFKPRSWCVFCPMGTITQEICKLKHRKEKLNGRKSEENCRVTESTRQ